MDEQIALFESRTDCVLAIPPAPQLVPHTDWPYPGMTPEASAQAAMSRTEAYHEMLAAVIKNQAGAVRLTDKQVLALVPEDWREACGRFSHGHMAPWVAQKHAIRIAHVSHDGGGFHFEFSPEGGTK